MVVATETEAAYCNLEPWFEFLHVHAAVTRELDRELDAEHGLAPHGYEVLRALARAPARRLRMSDLAARVLLTPSGITRLVAGLERGGLVERTGCREDARVTYARLTDEGAARLAQAARTYLDAVDRRSLDRLSASERSQLATLLALIAPAAAERAGDEARPPVP